MKNKIISLILSSLILISTFFGMSLISVSATDQYRYSTIHDFENMTNEQAQTIFSKKGGQDATFEIIEDSNQRALKMTFKPTYDGDYSRYEMKLPVPKDDHLVGMRAHFKGDNLHGGRFQLVYDGSWKNTDFLTGDVHSKDSLIGEETKEVIFTNKRNDIGEGRNNLLTLLLRGYSSTGSTTSIIIYDIEFIYDNPYKGYTKTIEDFEVMTEEETSNYMAQNGKNDDSAAAYTYSIATNGGYNYSNGLRFTKTAGSWINHRGPKIDLSDNNIIGMRVYYHLIEKVNNIRIQIVDAKAGSWTDVDFTDNNSVMDIGLYDRVVMLEGKTVNRNSDGLYLGLNFSDNKSVIIDEIQYIYSGEAPTGNDDQLSTLVNTTCKATYDAGNDLGTWSETSWARFVKYYENAQSMLNKTYTQPEFDDAYRYLNKAFSSLDQEGLNYVALEAAITAADAKKAESGYANYTKDSKTAFETAYAAAVAIKTDVNATQTSINDATKALSDAMNALAAPSYDFKAVDNKIYTNCENFDDWQDVGDGGWRTGGWEPKDLNVDLETQYPISGSKSARFYWENMSSDTWGRLRKLVNTGDMCNQAFYFEIVSKYDVKIVVELYQNQGGGHHYKYEKNIVGSMQPQAIVIPWKEFFNNKDKEEKLNTDVFNEINTNTYGMLQIQVNRGLGYPETGMIIIDNFAFVKEDTTGFLSTPTTNDFTAAYAAFEGTGDGSGGGNDGGNDGGNNGGNGDGTGNGSNNEPGADDGAVLGDAYTEIIKYDTPVKSAKLTAKELVNISGNGLYFYVKSATAQKMNIKITDKVNVMAHTYPAVRELNYVVDIEASTSQKLYSIDFMDYVDGFATWQELDRSKLEIDISFDGKNNDATICSVGTFSYPLLYLNKNNIDMGDIGSGGSNDSNNDNSNDNGSNDNGTNNNDSNNNVTNNSTNNVTNNYTTNNNTTNNDSGDKTDDGEGESIPVSNDTYNQITNVYNSGVTFSGFWMVMACILGALILSEFIFAVVYMAFKKDR